MRLVIFLALSLVLFGCPPTQQQQNQAPSLLTAEDFIKAMRSASIHNIRREPNRRLTDRTRAKAAYDIYVNQQQGILLELKPGQSPENFRGFFDGYLKQGYEFHSNGNLILVARSNLQKEVLEAFNGL